MKKIINNRVWNKSMLSSEFICVKKSSKSMSIFILPTDRYLGNVQVLRVLYCIFKHLRCDLSPFFIHKQFFKFVETY